MYEDIKEEMKRRYQNSRLPMLMQNYNDNKKKIQHPFINAGKAIYNGYKKLNGIDKAQSLIGKSYQPTEIGNAINSGVTGNALNNLSPISNAINSEVGSGISALGSNASNIGEGISALGNTSNAIQGASTATQGASSAAQGASATASGASSASSAAPVVGTALGALSAGNNFANGDYVNGGLDAAATGAMFIPGVGWAISGAIKIGQMLRNALNSKKQKQMQKAQQLSEKAIQDSENAIANKNAEFDQMQAENQQKMQQQLQANGAGMSSMLNQQPQMQTQQPSIDNKALVNDIFNQVQNGYEQPQAPKTQIYDGQITGGAANYDFNDNSFVPEQFDNSKLVYNDTPDKLFGSVGKGYVGDLPNLDAVQNTQDTNATPIVNNATPEENKKSILSNLGSFVSNFANGYDDNVSHGFREGDLWKQTVSRNQPKELSGEEGVATGDAAPVQQQKGFGTRMGEAFGTGARVMSNPWTQAALAGLITKATGGDWADAANNAYSYGTNKAKSDYYQKLINPNAKPSVLGNYGGDDYKAQYEAQRREIQNMVDMIKAQNDSSKTNAQIGRWDVQNENDTRNSKSLEGYRNTMSGVARQNASTRAGELSERKTHNRASEDIARERNNILRKNKAINNGDLVIMIDPSGNEVEVGADRVKEAISKGYSYAE